MWSSLSGLLVEVVKAGIAGVDVVEALWMVRIKQSSASKVYIQCVCVCVCVCTIQQNTHRCTHICTHEQKQTIVGGAANFLAKWFGAQSLEKKGQFLLCIPTLLLYYAV